MRFELILFVPVSPQNRNYKPDQTDSIFLVCKQIKKNNTVSWRWIMHSLIPKTSTIRLRLQWLQGFRCRIDHKNASNDFHKMPMLMKRPQNDKDNNHKKKIDHRDRKDDDGPPKRGRKTTIRSWLSGSMLLGRCKITTEFNKIEAGCFMRQKGVLMLALKKKHSKCQSIWSS